MPVLSDPAPKSSGPQKSISELRTQTVDLLRDAIAASGTPEGWYWDMVPPGVPWDRNTDHTQFVSCSTVGEKDSWQIEGEAYHDSIGEVHATAKIFTDHWSSQGFTIDVSIDAITQAGNPFIQLGADRADGIGYGLYVAFDSVVLHAYSECSTHPSIQYRLEHLTDPPVPQTSTPSP